MLEAARTGVATRCHVEDAFVDVDPLRHGGLPRVTVRFVVEAASGEHEDADAWQAAKALAASVGQVSDWRDLQVLRRSRGGWLPLSQA